MDIPISPGAARPTVANEDIFVIGLRRSGIHGIVSWLIPHLDGLTRFINDPMFMVGAGYGPMEGRPTTYYQTRHGRSCELLMGRDVGTQARRLLDKAGSEFVKQTHRLMVPVVRPVLKKFSRFRQGEFKREEVIPFAPEGELPAANRNLFVLENITPSEFAALYPVWRDREYAPYLAAHGLVPAPRVRLVLLVREPWNQLASILKSLPLEPPRAVPPEIFREKWLDYAREFSGETRQLEAFGDVVRIAYPFWFQDPAYRRELAVQLGAEPTDAGLHVVSNFGGGSSFDGQTYAGQAQQMKVGERWKAYAGNELMRELCANEQVRTLTQQIFQQTAPDLTGA